MCMRGPKMTQAPVSAPVAVPEAAKKTDVDANDLYNRLRKKKGATWLTRSNDRSHSILTAAADQAAKSQKTTLG